MCDEFVITKNTPRHTDIKNFPVLMSGIAEMNKSRKSVVKFSREPLLYFIDRVIDATGAFPAYALLYFLTHVRAFFRSKKQPQHTASKNTAYKRTQR